MCLAQGHNAVTLVSLEPTAPPSGVKHSTTEPPKVQDALLLWVVFFAFGLGLKFVTLVALSRFTTGASIFHLTLCLVSITDNLCEQFGHRSGPTRCMA